MRACILDDTIGSSIVDLHSIKFVFIRLDEVYDEVDNQITILFIFGHFNVRLCTFIGCRIIFRDLHYFGKELILSIF